MAYGATRLTHDSDCLVRQEKGNLARLTAALRELHARLRVSGLSDEESAALPVQVDSIIELGGFSNWRTDAGDLDVMVDMPDRNGRLRHYEDLAGDARVLDYVGAASGSPVWTTSSPARSSPTASRTKRPSPSCTSSKSGCEANCVIRRKTDTGSGAKRTAFRGYPDKVPAESGHL